MISLADDNGVGYSFALSDDVLGALRDVGLVTVNVDGSADNAPDTPGGAVSEAVNGATKSEAEAKENAANTSRPKTNKTVNSRGLTVSSVPSKSKSKATPAERLVISPREIQHFIRLGHTVEQLHQQYNVPVEHIQRYATPIQREKRVIVNLFQNLPARPSKRGRTLLNIASEYFDENRIDRYTASWDATKSGKQPWLITLKYTREGIEQTAQWYWDSKNSIISENDDNAKQITKYYEDATELGGGVNVSAINTHNADTDWGNAGGSSLKNITSSLRLRDLDRIKGELDHNFRELEGTAANAKRTLLSTHERSVSEVIKTVNASSDSESVANVGKESSDATLAEPANKDAQHHTESQTITAKSQIPATKQEVAPEIGEEQVDELTEIMQPETEMLENATTVDELNITGQLRAGLKRKRKQRSSVPSWDNVMLPKSNFQKRFDEEGDE